MAVKKLHASFPPIAYLAIFFAVLISGIMYTAYLYNRPLPQLVATKTPPASIQPEHVGALPWPATAQSAVGITERGVLASSTPVSDQKQLPTASVAKLMTALMVLSKKPLAIGDPGPTITITSNDVAIYNNYVAVDGSVAAVQEGEQISEYDALQALMLPSANNIADSLANWAFGSVDAYSAYANDYAKSHGLVHSTFSDASGFSPNTTSTANDLVMLGIMAHNNPVIAEIAAKKAADIPVAGTVYNVNNLLGQNGIDGLKTGNTDQAGGVFVTSAERTVDGHPVTIVTAVVGSPNLYSAMTSSVPLLDATAANLEQKTIVTAGQKFGTYIIPWAAKDHQAVEAIADKDVRTFIWKGDTIKTTYSLSSLNAPQSSGSAAGSVTVRVNNTDYRVPLTIRSDIPKPGVLWRLNR